MLWSLDAIQETFFRRGNNFSFPDNMDYFFGIVQDIMHQNYAPTKEDMLKARVRTAGIISHVYEAKGNQFEIYDVGGQRNERYIHIIYTIYICNLYILYTKNVHLLHI